MEIRGSKFIKIEGIQDPKPGDSFACLQVYPERDDTKFKGGAVALRGVVQEVIRDQKLGDLGIRVSGEGKMSESGVLNEGRFPFDWIVTGRGFAVGRVGDFPLEGYKQAKPAPLALCQPRLVDSLRR